MLASITDLVNNGRCWSEDIFHCHGFYFGGDFCRSRGPHLRLMVVQVAASLEIIAAALSDGGSTWVHLWPDSTLPVSDDPSLSVLVVSVALSIDQLGTSLLQTLLHYFVGNVAEAEVGTGVSRIRVDQGWLIEFWFQLWFWFAKGGVFVGSCVQFGTYSATPVDVTAILNCCSVRGLRYSYEMRKKF